MRVAATLCLSVWLAGCEVFNEPLASAVREPPELPAFLATLHVRVHRPSRRDRPFSNEKDDEEGYARAVARDLRTQWTDKMILDLGDAGIFRSVGYEEDVTNGGQPFVRVRVVDAPALLAGHCDPPVPVLTLGLVPSDCHFDKEVYLHFSGQKDIPDLECPWPTTSRVGWIRHLLAVPPGGWTEAPNRPALLTYLRSCVAAAADRFSRAARSE